jgi:hypothetical protein
MIWNQDETAFAVETSYYNFPGGTVWGYNTITHNLFLPEVGVADSLPIWTTDGTHLLYQHQTITRTEAYTVTFSPRQIRLVAAASGDEQIIISNPKYDYHLCAEPYEDDCQWRGDWIPIRQIPHQPRPFYFEDYNISAYRCSWHGSECSGNTVHLGLNWRTGEVILWGDVNAPISIPQFTPSPLPGPNLTVEPIYANNEIGYELYLGNNNRSLWCVPEGSRPIQWVEDSEAFVYVP